MTPSDAYAVALRDPSAAPRLPAALLAARGLGVEAARSFMRNQPGFLGRALTLKTARELVQAAESAGLATVLAREEDIHAPPRPLKASKIELKTGGITAVMGGAVKFIPYEAITLIAAAAYDAPAPPVRAKALEAGLFRKILQLAGVEVFRPLTESEPLETYFRADIIAENGALRLLLRPEDLDFSPLGPELRQSSLDNFRTLLGRLSAPCFGAARNAFLEAFLSGTTLSPLKLASEEACDTALSRLLLVAPRRAG